MKNTLLNQSINLLAEDGQHPRGVPLAKVAVPPDLALCEPKSLLLKQILGVHITTSKT